MTYTAFRELVYDYYYEHKRSLPWRRTTTTPYHILVSEMMLQQTQIKRVEEYYKKFIGLYPTVTALSKASLYDVQRLWSGLGYNRRGKFLLLCARYIVTHHKGKVPATYKELVQLPGIGDYTANAILAFAYNKDVPVIETNIRTVYIHHFFKNKTNIQDKEILAIIQKTLPQGQACKWYSALMDYGTHLKSLGIKVNNKSKLYKKQSSFIGSDREVRARIVKILLTNSKSTIYTLKKEIQDIRVKSQLHSLIQENMIHKNKQGYYTFCK